MEQSNQSMRHLLFTLGRYVDMECNKWTPLVPQDSQVECFSRRADVVEWMLSLNKIFTFSDETYFLAVQIFDRVLIRIKVHMRYLTCIGLACLYLAAKLNEEDSDVPVTYDLIETSRCRFSEKELLRMERCLLDKLHWSLLSSPTSLQFIHLFYALVRAKCPSLHTSSDTNVPDVLTTALTRCLLHDELLNHSPSVVALSVFSLYLKMSWEHWLPAVNTLQALIKVSDEQLSQCNGLVEGFVGSYMREAVVKNSILSHLNLNNNNNNSVKQECSPSGPAAQEVQMMGSLSVFSNKTPLSNPVTPVPPAKRRRVEMDDEVYSDIRSLYEPSEPPRKFREVTPLMSYAAVVRSSCATEALQHGSSALALSLQRVASI